MSWLQIRLFGPYFSSFSTNSYGYYSQTSQNLVSNTQIFASALIVRQAARKILGFTKTKDLSIMRGPLFYDLPGVCQTPKNQALSAVTATQLLPLGTIC